MRSPNAARNKPKTPTARSVNSAREVVNKSKIVAKRRNVSRTQAEDEGTQRENKGTMKKSAGTRRKRISTNQEKDKTEADGNQGALKVALREFAISTIKKGTAGLVSEFNAIKAATVSIPAKTAFDANPDKNRYKDVFCGDESRVVLNWPPGCTNDYIHGNFAPIRGNKRFICTQGPLDKTVDDFWRMVWGLKCRAIVMLCNVTEQGKPKCAKYFPDEPGEMMTTASNITIENIDSSDAEKILTVTNLKLTIEGGETTTVRHFFWTSWPDRGVPTNIMACLRLLARLKTYTSVVVHCSAGIGRTGTIVALEMAQQTILNGDPLSFMEIVKELRKHRHGSVQTDVQYVYIHRVMMGLAENKKCVTHEETAPFYTDYEAFLKSRDC